MQKARLTELSKKFPAPAPPAAASPEPVPAPSSTPTAPARRGRTGVTTFLAEEAHRQLRQLALDERRSGQALVIEALNDLFRKYNRPPHRRLTPKHLTSTY